MWPLVSGLWPLVFAFLVSCTHNLDLLEGPDSVALTTTGTWASMIYLARTDSGVIAIDLGWTRAEERIREGLATLGATPADVKYVFLTHGHRDHTGGWRVVKDARFVLGAAEVPFFTGDSAYHASLPRLGDELVDSPNPGRGEVSLLPLGADTAIVLGRDTVVALAIPGHTAGSTAYLFRGVLFGGDAINWRPFEGFHGARPEFSDNVEESRASMRALWARVEPQRVRAVCSAHAKCAVADSTVRRTTID